MRPLGARHVWLSITPEPESELPRAIATLRSGGEPPPELVEREAARAEALVLADASDDPVVAGARAVIEDVVKNHDNLELAL